MIDEINRCLEAWIRADAGLPPEVADVNFDQPESDWSGRRPVPMVNLFLFELTRSDRRAVAGYTVVTQADGGRSRQERAPMFEARYLISVWGGGSGIEHDVLARVVNVLARSRFLPAAHLTDALRRADTRPTLSLATHQKTTTTQVWSALNVSARAGVQLLVEAPMGVPAEVQLPPAPTSVRLDSQHLREPAAYARRRRGVVDAPAAGVARAVRRPATAGVTDTAGVESVELRSVGGPGEGGDG